MKESKRPQPSLDALRRKIDKIQAKRHKEDEPPSSEASNAGKAMHMATELLAAVGVGGMLGYGLDHLIDTSPIFFILCFFLGFIAGVRNMLRNFNTF